MAIYHEVQDHPDQEYLYTVKVRRPFRLECADGDPERCFHDGTDDDAIAVFEADLCARLTHEGWKVEVTTREAYTPTAQEAILRMETLLDQAKADSHPLVFSRIVHLARHMKANLDKYDDRDKKEARNVLARARRRLGL